MLLGEVAMYIQNLGEPLDDSDGRRTLLRTFSSTAKFLDSIPGVLAAVDGSLDTKEAWHKAWVTILDTREHCALCSGRDFPRAFCLHSACVPLAFRLRSACILLAALPAFRMQPDLRSESSRSSAATPWHRPSSR